MPLTRLVADALGVVTICLVSLLVLAGLLCILYSACFRYRIERRGFIQLRYFNKPWIIRITLISFAIWWGFGEIIRLSFLRRGQRVLHALSPKWQETFCKAYILSNLGFAEPCLFLTIVFLLRASMQMKDLGGLSQKWNGRTAGYILFYCLPLFVLQIIVILAGPKFNNIMNSYSWKMPHYFTSSAFKIENDVDNIALCTYPLLSTILLGIFAILLIVYLLWLGRRMAYSVINKGLQRRVLFLISSVSGCFPLRVIFLGLSVLSHPEHVLFEAFVFTAFLVLLACTGLSICLLVYYPVADSLALRAPRDLEIGRGSSLEDSVALIGNEGLVHASSTTSLGRTSDDTSTKRGSISFRTMLKDDDAPAEEPNEFSPSNTHLHQLRSPSSSPGGSPALFTRLMLPLPS
ncbi:hypothetical protein GIB67_029943 [Kingdonia uniflora]|uniref:Uncharacterized protein n=1 Tax=Kingdonia uniflora TaxID=39325 RepID=A0A7J7MXP1_9MAGN|nr:hypothetical protein GIB67_029943 [Kingdonia uniflora]